MSPAEALDNLSAEKGRSFDPRVVEVMERRYLELEAMVNAMETERRRLDITPKIDRDAAPSSGYADAPNEAEVRAASFLTSIISARQEAQLLFELAQTLGNSLSLKETLSVVASRLKQMIPHDAIAFYVCQSGLLIPEYAHGIDYDIFSTLRIPSGQGLSGWVALNEKPINNGNPAAETLHTGVPSRVTTLQAALSIPLRGHDGVAGVLTLYGREKNCFTTEHLRMLLAASSKLGLSVENALQFEKAQRTASTDFLTGLPNTRSICLHLERELARLRRSKKPLAVLLCDLNGFKKVNDTFGHLTGNKLLQEIAVKFRSCCRDYDEVGRLGGDEFVFVLPEITKDTISEVQERLSRVVEEASHSTCPEMIVSVSVGSSFYPEDGTTGEKLLSEADRSMYDMKEKYYSTAEMSPGAVRANVD
jgi:diguanylate cyclase (GGDEF)-like protein